MGSERFEVRYISGLACLLPNSLVSLNFSFGGLVNLGFEWVGRSTCRVWRSSLYIWVGRCNTIPQSKYMYWQYNKNNMKKCNLVIFRVYCCYGLPFWICFKKIFDPSLLLTFSWCQTSLNVTSYGFIWPQHEFLPSM